MELPNDSPTYFKKVINNFNQNLPSCFAQVQLNADVFALGVCPAVTPIGTTPFTYAQTESTSKTMLVNVTPPQ